MVPHALHCRSSGTEDLLPILVKQIEVHRILLLYDESSLVCDLSSSHSTLSGVFWAWLDKMFWVEAYVLPCSELSRQLRSLQLQQVCIVCIACPVDSLPLGVRLFDIGIAAWIDLS